MGIVDQQPGSVPRGQRGKFCQWRHVAIMLNTPSVASRLADPVASNSREASAASAWR